MNHLDFIAWMTLFPISQAICRALHARFVPPQPVGPVVDGLAHLVLVGLWLGIAYKLW